MKNGVYVGLVVLGVLAVIALGADERPEPKVGNPVVFAALAYVPCVLLGGLAVFQGRSC
ncbi:hypothetical protein [Kribbella antibiotica]|uniref:hypothetical protein n=1 Tax=Kribbella antibiotica TaxID=190195 RepID=UPI001404C5DF|nr:hypothetical protein [Kribbella antibiotica]